MGVCTVDLKSIQTKLIHTVNALDQNDANVQVDWPGAPPLTGPSPDRLPRSGRGADFSTAVDTLRQRAEPSGTGAYSALDADLATEAYVKRLSAMVHKINQLSSEQERAIAEIQRIQARLAHGYPATDPMGQPVVTPHVDYQRAVIALAEADGRGNVVLAYRTVAPKPPLLRTDQPRPAYGEANQLASHLRTTYGHPPARGWRMLVSEVLTLGREPSQLVAQLGRAAWSLISDFTQGAVFRWSRASESLHGAFDPQPGAFDRLSGKTSLSLVDSMLWFGGGVIGRLALNLLLGAFPALWSLAVAAITAVTAYALYRATLAPKLAFGPALRVALLVVGLVVGGQI
ncbi:hypothetical protein [Nodosilinea nodulosa]|uniref:hypothetical protein n=1 Tax=Nodosilinea nodulosa TaxID=416001 RepID=UPI00037457FD|nr:hypothetical protein [Nodosilinea nodulosa]